MAPPEVLERGLATLRASWPDVATKAVPVTGYDLQYRRSGDDDWVDGPQHETGTDADLANLETDTSYEVRVRAANAAGDGEWSEPAEGFTAFWTATLGVGRLFDSPNGYLGYQRRDYNSFGSLTPHSFTNGGVEYDIFILSLYRGSRTDSAGVHTRAIDFYVIEHAFPEDWMLRVDDGHYRIGDGEQGDVSELRQLRQGGEVLLGQSRVRCGIWGHLRGGFFSVAGAGGRDAGRSQGGPDGRVREPSRRPRWNHPVRRRTALWRGGQRELLLVHGLGVHRDRRPRDGGPKALADKQRGLVDPHRARR